MLTTLLKILVFFAVILSVALGLNYLSSNAEGVQIIFQGTEYTLGPVATLVALVVGMVAAWALLRLLGVAWAVLRFLMGDKTAINRYFDRNRERKGYHALTEGMLAVAAGEGKLAQEKATKAAKYLDDPRATRLLAAQAAEVSGDRRKAEEVYRALLDDDATRFVGVRGLMQQKLAEGDTATALELAKKAYALKPRHEELRATLLKLQTESGDWQGARAILKDERRQGALPQDVHIRRDAVLALQQARDVLAEENSISAREAAISANRASPDLIPAAVLAARSYLAKDEPKKAARVLEKTWSVRPHPDIAAAYAEIAPDETPSRRLRRFEALIRQNPEDSESKLLKAELMLAAEDFPGARRALGDLAETKPTVRSLSIMAAVERGEGADDSVVRGWLARALGASRGPQWVCDKCHHVQADWAPVCESCGGFDTLSWREPDEKRSATVPNGVELLPLIVGRPKGSEAHVERSFDEADAYAEGADEAARHHKPKEIVVADVDPGMVPRESDFVKVKVAGDDSRAAKPTTKPEAKPEAKSDAGDKAQTPPDLGEPAPEAPSESKVITLPADAKTDAGEPVPVRPDVEPPEQK